MQQFIEPIHAARAFLETEIHPNAPAFLLVVLTWAAQYLVRRFFPGAWETMANLPFPNGAHKPTLVLLRKAWQAAPSLATGALLSSLSGGDATEAVLAALLNAFAPVWHEALKAIPQVPYVGGRPPAALPKLEDKSGATLPPIAPDSQDEITLVDPASPVHRK